MVEPAPVNPGDVLAGKYRVERVLGVGGMGVVVAATHLELGQLVALKFLLPAAELNADATARFLREARAAVRISSEHVARVTDVGRLENSSPYMVMEYLDGVDLGEHPKGAALPIENAVDFVLQACEAIAVAHALGIVHRDLKPANLFLTRRPDGSELIKVLDFGISKVVELNESNAALTKTSAVMGSPLYMSPEQMRSARNVDVRTDVWALGTILHELIAGTPPFGGETLGEVFAAVMTAEVTPLRALRPETPERLERLVQRSLAKDPTQRVANVAELAVGLAEFAPPRARALVARVQGVLERAGMSNTIPSADPMTDLGVAGAATARVAATDTSWSDQATRGNRSSKRSLAVGLAGLALFAVVGAAALHWARPKPADSPASGTAPVAPVSIAPATISQPAVVVEPLTSALPPEASPPSPAPNAQPNASTAARPAPISAATRAPVSAPRARTASPAVPATAATPLAPVAQPATAVPAPAPPARVRNNPLRIDFK